MPGMRMEDSPIATDDLNAALGLYLDRDFGFPRRNDHAVLQQFGDIDGPPVLNAVRSIIDEAVAITPDWEWHTPRSGAALARSQMKRRHPQLDDASLDLLEWTFSYSWK